LIRWEVSDQLDILIVVAQDKWNELEIKAENVTGESEAILIKDAGMKKPPVELRNDNVTAKKDKLVNTIVAVVKGGILGKLDRLNAMISSMMDELLVEFTLVSVKAKSQKTLTLEICRSPVHCGEDFMLRRKRKFIVKLPRWARCLGHWKRTKERLRLWNLTKYNMN